MQDETERLLVLMSQTGCLTLTTLLVNIFVTIPNADITNAVCM